MPYRQHISDRDFKRLVSIRRKIHRYPEPAFEEHRTAGVIMKELDRLKIPYRRGLAGTGVLARIEGKRPGPTIALRADMDALAVEEKTGLPFRSRRKGYMHACGHDGHVAIMLGAAGLISSKPPEEGSVVIIFQPAEEGGGGAERLVKLGALKGVDMIFAGHIDRHYDIGQIAIRPDVETSYTDELDIHIIGEGGHAAYPHETVDAVVVASLFVVALQNIVSRSVSPVNPTVVSIGALNAGSAYNAIADEARLKGTIRNTDSTTRKRVIRNIQKTASALASLHEARIEVSITEGYPPVINDPEGFRLSRSTAMELLGEDSVLTIPKPSLGGEDFAYYIREVPGCLVRIGGVGPDTPHAAMHSSCYDFDEEAIRIGSVYFYLLAHNAIEHLKEKSHRDKKPSRGR
jgi:hippurate hydrolase